MFNTTPTDEYLRCAAAFGWGLDELCALALNGVRAATLPADERTTLERDFLAEFAALRAEPSPGR